VREVRNDLDPRPAERRRGLVLAGGGMKAAYAGGVLERLLPALGHTAGGSSFRHVQACSSGVFNAAMMAQGKEGPDIGEAWRRVRPLRGLSPNWSQLWKVFRADSLLKYDRFMKNVVKLKTRDGWGLEFPLSPSDPACKYVFNAYDFSRHALVAFSAESLDEEAFKACVALPRWFPPVDLPPAEGQPPDVFVDAVFATDSNAAVLADEDLGLEEIWVIWTVDVQGVWRNGWANNYFRMLEQSAAAAYRRERDLICKADFVPAHDVERGAARPSKILYEISGDVPVHYLFTFTRGAMRRAVRQGFEDADRYLLEHLHLWAAT
jgi:predicted acylesterase/phospholipase RssA